MTEENLAASTGESSQETGAADEQNDIVEQTNDSEPATEPADEQPAQDAQAQTETETSGDQQPQPTDLPPGFEPTVESVVEAVLFASDESLTPARLSEIVGTNVRQLRKHIDDLNEKYKANNNAFRIEQIAGGYQMLTLSEYNHWLKKLVRARDDGKLSQPALETLAIIAYKQPIIRADIEAIRGVAAGEMIRNLMYKGLVKITGRAEIVGRPMLYGTTKKFLEVFGLNALKDLPKAEELKKPD
ncbi:MAG: SMC-Scp complex subunit ScpB [Sedimentisphaerales bacterium]